MDHSKQPQAKLQVIVFVDAVNFTQELKTHGRDKITPKINHLQELTQFFFVHKLKGKMIGQQGDGFLVLCPPKPAEVISEALSCLSFISAYNFGKEPPYTLNTRIAVHFGLIAPPERGNYIDSNLNLTARLEGATPANCICISSVLQSIVTETLRHIKFEELKSDFRGLGEQKYYIVLSTPNRSSEPSRQESRLSFYLSILNEFRMHEDWESVGLTCEQALLDFPENPEFTMQLGFARYVLDDYAEAIRNYENCVKMNYELGEAFLYLGRAYACAGNGDRAIEMYIRATENDPKPYHAFGDIAEIYMMRAELNEALRYAKESLKVNPHYLFPVALQIVISLIKQEDNAELVQSIRLIEEHRWKHLRREIDKCLRPLRLKQFSSKLDVAFKLASCASEDQAKRDPEPEHHSKKRAKSPKKFGKKGGKATGEG